MAVWRTCPFVEPLLVEGSLWPPPAPSSSEASYRDIFTPNIRSRIEIMLWKRFSTREILSCASSRPSSSVVAWKLTSCCAMMRWPAWAFNSSVASPVDAAACVTLTACRVTTSSLWYSYRDWKDKLLVAIIVTPWNHAKRSYRHTTLFN